MDHMGLDSSKAENAADVAEGDRTGKERPSRVDALLSTRRLLASSRHVHHVAAGPIHGRCYLP
jgi:hypothetical protein